MSIVSAKLFSLAGVTLACIACTIPVRPGGTLPAAAAAGQRNAKPSIVLVHGAFADGSSWNRLIPLLERSGYTVTAVQNPLSSLADDVATTKRVIEAQKGPVIVVGHSYGGTVITEAAAGNENVRALVYIAAFAPDTGEAIGELGKRYAPPALATALVPDAAGFLYINRAKFHNAFCADVPTADSRVMAATQKPIAAGCFATPVGKAAWKSVPSWYIVAQNDRAINPDLERFMAKRIGAKITEIKSSHVPFLSHPGAVTRVIESAARAAK